jgi:hypothetical protein
MRVPAFQAVSQSLPANEAREIARRWWAWLNFYKRTVLGAEDVTDTELARHLDVSQAAVNAWKDPLSVRVPDTRTLLRLRRLLGDVWPIDAFLLSMPPGAPTSQPAPPGPIALPPLPASPAAQARRRKKKPGPQ